MSHFVRIFPKSIDIFYIMCFNLSGNYIDIANKGAEMA